MKFNPLLYTFIKPFVRFASLFFVRKLVVNHPHFFSRKGPLLLAANHPNSFLDAVLLAVYFRQPVYSLARGDAFRNKRIARILQALHILPVYRVSEGVENLSSNYDTFNTCKSILAKGGIILIFSEGLCVNEWHLRPLKKGTARLAFSCWEDNIPVEVLPVGINYSSFRRFGKNVFIGFGPVISRGEMPLEKNDGIRYLAFNNRLRVEMELLVFEIPHADKKMQQDRLTFSIPAWKKAILFLPAIAGWLLHVPVSFSLKKIVWGYTAKNDHYDSAIAALFILLYPFYLLLLALLSGVTFHSWLAALFTVLLVPFAGWSYLQLKPQTTAA